MKFLITLFILVFVTCFFGCQHATQYDCTGVTPTYKNNVKPILDSYCAMPDMGCHGANGDAFSLADYSSAASASSKKSFMGAIEHLTTYQNMPKGGVKMPDDQIHILSCWVENGSPE
jgi:hypothetical protein